ncbi:hypothetical protein CQ12_11545 [Bradyrhizobium jicamae]|uniref:Uncharacterized protein n=1 Tax=Bradyrhizobium jicamae TaxID=280332 RepID=A0A0R3LKI0_9BRAD|nr:hypothetical protein CQ12_11545 [Bradyrhizobium jicamae]
MVQTWDFQIHVASENGRPASNWDIRVDFGIWRDDASGVTDDEGWAELAIEVGDHQESALVAQSI